MRCCVAGCKNDSRHISKSQGITFHVFPTEPSLRTAWLRALNKEDWEPKDRSTVCSEHFLKDDLYETKSGLRKVRVRAVPIVVPESTSCEYGEIASLKVCRICLTVDSKMFPIRKYKLEQAYEHLTGLSLCTEDRLPEKLCVECVQRLLNCSKFRNKSLRANSLMLEIIKKHDSLTIQNIKNINRENNQLISNLTTTHFEPDHHNLFIEFDENAIHRPIEVEIDIKDETDDLFLNETEEKIDFNDEKTEFDTNIDKIEGNNEIVDDKNDFDNDNIDDNDYVQDRDYSSDDSLPLKKRKKKEKVKEQKKEVKKVRKKVKEKDDQPKIDRRRKPFLNDDLNETLFTITDLTFEEQVAEILKRQDSANYKNSVFKCTECFKGFLDEDAYNSHMSRHSVECGEYQCDICKTHFKHPHALRKHITAHHTQRFSCNQCPYETTHRQTARLHERWHKGTKYKCPHCPDEFVFSCNQCPYETTHRQTARLHEKWHKGTKYKCPHCPDEFVFSCNQCPYETTHRQTARLHEKWHKGTKYKCPHCPDEFVKFTTYMGHIRIKHPSDFVCQLCGYSFVSEKGIQLHKKLKHRLDDVQIPDDGPFCELCNVRFVSAEAHRRHISVSARHNTNDKEGRESNKPKKAEVHRRHISVSARHNTNDKEGRESNKPKKGRKPRDVKDREKRAKEAEDEDSDRRSYPSQMRKAEGPIPCEQCGLQLEDSRAYHGHFRRMHPDKNRTNYPSMKSPCMCEVCGRMFQSYALLKDHTWTHTGERPFKCDVCGKAFRMKQRLVAHRRVHSTDKHTYGCQLCGKQFSTHSNRQRHMFIHTGLKPFKCEMCGKGFKHASEKRAHITYVHLKKPWPKRSRGKRRTDGRPGPMPPQAVPTSGEMEMTTLWPMCDPKLGDMNNIIEDKPMYYNLKI